MFEVLKFIIKCITDFMAMLFTIDVGFTSLGMLMCVIFLFFPVVLTFINFLKFIAINEIDERYDLDRSLRPNYIGKHQRGGYVGKHEYKGRHSKAYLNRKG